MADLDDFEQLQGGFEIVEGPYANSYFEDLLFNIVNFAKSRMLEGDGSPEGVVEADKRSMYVDLTGTVGQRLYYKTTETGNTGWLLL